MIAALVLSCAFKAAVLLRLVWAVSFTLRKQSAALRHFVWITALIAVGLLLLLQTIPFGWNQSRRAGDPPIHSSAAMRNLAGTASSFVVEVIDSLPRHRSVSRWIELIWLSGTLIAAMRLLASIVALWRRNRATSPCSDSGVLSEAERCARNAGVTRPGRILLSREPCGMPSTFGFFRPVILLPGDCGQWPRQRLRVVLLHEMSHIRRADWVCGIIAQVCLTLYWFHPLVWMAAYRLREESEAACDNMVLTAGEAASTYAEELLNVVRGALRFRGAPTIAIAMAHSTQLERRITAMLNETIDRRRLTRKAMFFTTTAALLALLPLSALRSPAQNLPGSVSGTVLDPTGATVPAATVIATNRSTRSRDMTTTDANGVYHFEGLPAGDYELRFLKPGFAERQQSSTVCNRGSTENATLEMGALSETINVMARGTGNMVQSTAPQRIVVGGSVQAANLIRQVKPRYPDNAKAAGVQGAVILEATIGADGVPNSLQVMNAHIDPELAMVAVHAVKQWLYRPTLLNGQPVEVRTNITVNFTLAN